MSYFSVQNITNKPVFVESGEIPAQTTIRVSNITQYMSTAEANGWLIITPISLANIGPMGPAGPVGPTGPEGPTGPVGPVGPAVVVDAVPTDGSPNAVSSDGVFDALAGKASLNGAETLTNKRVVSRSVVGVSSATPAINTDTTDFFKITNQAVNITSMSSGLTGTPTDGQAMLIEITATSTLSINWGASFESSLSLLPSTIGTEAIVVGLLFRSTTGKWRCMGVA